jgi:hypothetical protein
MTDNTKWKCLCKDHANICPCWMVTEDECEVCKGMTWVAEYSPDGGIEDQVFFGTDDEAMEFCDYMNPDDKRGVGCAFLWYSYELKINKVSLEEAKRLYKPRHGKYQ